MDSPAKSALAGDAGTLRSWKEIAAHLGRSVRTVQRWEKEFGLPVHRVSLAQRGAIHTTTQELDGWWASRSKVLENEEEATKSEVTTADVAPVDTVSLSDASRPAASLLKRWRLVVIPLAVALIAVSVLSVARHSSRPAAALLSATVITAPGGDNDHPALSPDGKSIAFTNSGQLYIKGIGDDVPRLLVSGLRVLSGVWSPNGQQIAYLQTVNDTAAQLRIRDLHSSKDWQAAEVGYVADFPRGPVLAWGPEGTSILLTKKSADGFSAPIFKLTLADGRMQQLTAPSDPAVFDEAPRVSPDEKLLAFERIAKDYSVQICSVPLAAALRTPPAAPDCLELPYRSVHGITFENSHTLIAALAKVGLTPELWRVSVDGRTPPVRLVLADEITSEPSFANGTLAYVAGGMRVALRHYHVAGSQAQFDRVLAPSTRMEILPALSPDGSKVAFLSTRSGAFDAWVTGLDPGSVPRRISSLNGGNVSNIVWSPDGQLLAFGETVDRHNAVYLADLAGSAVRRLPLLQAGECYPNGFSSNARFVYLGCGDTHGSRLVQFDVATNQEEQITSAGPGCKIQPGADAFTVYELCSHSSGLVKVDLRSGKSTTVVPGKWGSFSAEGWDLLLEPQTVPFETHCYTAYSFRTGKANPIGACACNAPGATLSPDGKQLVCGAGDINTELKFVRLQ